tara:strand:- start:20511 stop:21941 length:1431 start_codon:yes stop_codon:yes gene_type:complete
MRSLAKDKKLISKSSQLRTLPHSLEAEEAVFGSIFNKPEIYNEVKEYIPNKNVFYSESSQIIWEKITEVVSNKKTVDIVTISSHLTEDQKRKVTGYYLTGLLDATPSPSNAKSYAKVVLDKYLQRKLIETTYQIQDSAYDNLEEFETILKRVKRTTDELTALSPSTELSLDKIVESTLESIETSGNYVKFGYDKLDNLAGGMTKGEITVIAGRPGHGKTTFSVNLVRNFLDQGLRVLMINREMTNIEMMKKLLVLVSGKLSYATVRRNDMDEASYNELIKTQHKIIDNYNGLLTMVDTARDLNASTAAIAKYKPDVVIDDYIQLIKMDGYDQRRFELETVMNEYKWLAKTYQIVPVLISQLNRDIEKRIDPIPKMSDLAESGSIEQVAENVLFVYYDYKVNYENSELGREKTQIVAAKVRYGENRKLMFGFNGDKVSFYDNVLDKDEVIVIQKDEELEDIFKRVKQIGISEIKGGN